MDEYSILEILTMAEDPLAECAGSPVISAASFETLANILSESTEIVLAAPAIFHILKEESKRFSACGANNSEKYGVLRKSKVTGWVYIEALLT